jgi:hypothetical protein
MVAGLRFAARRLRRQLSMAALRPRREEPVASVIVVLVLIDLTTDRASSAQYHAHRELEAGETYTLQKRCGQAEIQLDAVAEHESERE